MATLPYWNNGEVISSDKLNSMVASIIAGDPLAVKVSNATKNDVNQIVGYLSSLHDKAKTNLNSATSTSDLDSAYNNMTALVSNKLGAYANDDTVDLYSTGIRASIITFLQAYDNMMSNDRLNNKNTDNTLGSRIDSETHDRENADNAINTTINAMKANGGGRNLAIGTASKKNDRPRWGADGGQVSLDTWKSLRGQWVTISCDMSWTGFTRSTKDVNRIGYEVGLHYSDGSQQYIGNWYTPTDSDVNKNFRYGCSWKLLDKELTSINEGWLYNQIDATICVTSKLMIEKGTVAHDWQPAPEDINSAIENVNTKADANTASISKITSNGGGRNLLTGTSGDWITKTATGWMLVTTADSTKTSVADYHTGDSFTYSETVTNKSNSDVRLAMYCCDNNGNRLNGDSHHVLSDFVAPNTNAKRISCTITIDSNTWYVEHTLIADDGTSDSKTVQIKGEMFEAGIIAHDWQPAPEDTQSQLDNLNVNKISSSAVNWNLVANNSSNTYNYASGSKITFPNNSSITIKDDRIIPRIYLPTYITDYLTNTELNVIATMGEYDNVFIPSATMSTLGSRPTNPDTGASLTGDCFFTNHYAYSGTNLRAFQKIYSCDYNYTFTRSYNGSSGSWTNWSCLTPYA